ncbi:MAG: DUF4249 family protein [Bacteroidales bacterium]|nr:DUF4249 family protein [Bacteroidales bacterium]
MKKMWFKKIIITVLICSIIFLFIKCESNDRYYRPDLPEQLCCIGIIDADDTISYNPQDPYSLNNYLRYISFEKSYQSEYTDERNDSLRNFSFSIASQNEEIFSFNCDSSLKIIESYKLPENMKFVSGERYFLKASEKNSNNITAEITVPEPPSNLVLNSVHKETEPATEFIGCNWPFDDSLKYAIINISFDINNKWYYALLLEGIGNNFSFPPGILEYLDFSIKESNVHGFFAAFHGLKMYHQICIEQRLYCEESPVKAYFIDGSQVLYNNCDMTLLVKFNDGYSFFNIFSSFRIKLLSIPQELYLFEKSLYTYETVARDPFSEPVYLNSNIINGNGIFAICRSTTATITLPFPPAF